MDIHPAQEPTDTVPKKQNPTRRPWHNKKHPKQMPQIPGIKADSQEYHKALIVPAIEPDIESDKPGPMLAGNHLATETDAIKQIQSTAKPKDPYRRADRQKFRFKQEAGVTKNTQVDRVPAEGSAVPISHPEQPINSGNKSYPGNFSVQHGNKIAKGPRHLKSCEPSGTCNDSGQTYSAQRAPKRKKQYKKKDAKVIPTEQSISLERSDIVKKTSVPRASWEAQTGPTNTNIPRRGFKSKGENHNNDCPQPTHSDAAHITSNARFDEEAGLAASASDNLHKELLTLTTRPSPPLPSLTPHIAVVQHSFTNPTEIQVFQPLGLQNSRVNNTANTLDPKRCLSEPVTMESKEPPNMGGSRRSTSVIPTGSRNDDYIAKVNEAINKMKNKYGSPSACRQKVTSAVKASAKGHEYLIRSSGLSSQIQPVSEPSCEKPLMNSHITAPSLGVDDVAGNYKSAKVSTLSTSDSNEQRGNIEGGPNLNNSSNQDHAEKLPQVGKVKSELVPLPGNDILRNKSISKTQRKTATSYVPPHMRRPNMNSGQTIVADAHGSLDVSNKAMTSSVRTVPNAEAKMIPPHLRGLHNPGNSSTQIAAQELPETRTKRATKIHRVEGRNDTQSESSHTPATPDPTTRPHREAVDRRSLSTGKNLPSTESIPPSPKLETPARFIPPHLRYLTSDAINRQDESNASSKVPWNQVARDTSYTSTSKNVASKNVASGAEKSNGKSSPENSEGEGTLQQPKATQDSSSQHRPMVYSAWGSKDISPGSNGALGSPPDVSTCQPLYYKGKKLIGLHDLLPPHLRNLEKPVLRFHNQSKVVKNRVTFDDEPNASTESTKPQVSLRKKNAAQAALDDARQTTDTKSVKLLTLELGPDEEAPMAITKVDFSRSYGEGSHESQQLSSNWSPKMPEPRGDPYRWFSKIPSASSDHEEPKETLEYEIAGWDGDWMPAPVEWDARRQHVNNSAVHIKWMENWMQGRVTESLERPYKLDITTEAFLSGVYPTAGTRKEYRFLLPGEEGYMARTPLYYGPIDWMEVETLRTRDPWSHDQGRLHQTSTKSAIHFSDGYYKEKKAQRAEKEARREEIREFKKSIAPPPGYYVPHANIYIRPAQVTDMPQVTGIYNYYIKHTVHAIELEETSEDEWRSRHMLVSDEKLPFLVAVLKRTSRHSDRRDGGDGRDSGRGRIRSFGPGRNGHLRHLPTGGRETVVGFSYAEDYAGKNTMYQNTVELQLFVSPDHLRVGIGKTLMDRIIPALDSSYQSKKGTDFINPDHQRRYDIGGNRSVRMVLVHIAHHGVEDEHFKWQKKWLEMEWDFDHVSTLPCFGEKFGNPVYVEMMIMETCRGNLGYSFWYSNDNRDRIPHRDREKHRLAQLEADKMIH